MQLKRNADKDLGRSKVEMKITRAHGGTSKRKAGKLAVGEGEKCP